MRRDAAGGSNSTEFLRGRNLAHGESKPRGFRKALPGGGGGNTGEQETEDSNSHQAWSQGMTPLLSEERLFI